MVIYDSPKLSIKLQAFAVLGAPTVNSPKLSIELQRFAVLATSTFCGPKVSIKLQPFAVLFACTLTASKSVHRTATVCSFVNNPFFPRPKSVHRTAEVCSFVHIPSRCSQKHPQNCNRLQFWMTDHRTATVCSFDPQFFVWVELQPSAVLMALFRTSIYGRCPQVYCSAFQ
jgi:hypothetical protein